MDQHLGSCTAMLPAGTLVLVPRCPFPGVVTHGRPKLGLDPLPSHAHTHSPTHPPSCSGLSLSPNPAAFLQS